MKEENGVVVVYEERETTKESRKINILIKCSIK